MSVSVIMVYWHQNQKQIMLFTAWIVSSEKQWDNGNCASAWRPFQRSSRGKIREKLLRSGNIYAVIGLPANLFYNTSIPTCIIVLKKHRDGRDVLFIDASKKFNKGKNKTR